jgi:uncharacterized protein YfeS
MTGKRGSDLEGSLPNSKSKAARFNAHVLKRLQAAVIRNPEINLAEQFPTEYVERLMEMQNPIQRSPSTYHETTMRPQLILLFTRASKTQS